MSNLDLIAFFNTSEGFAWIAAARDAMESLVTWLQTKYHESPALLLAIAVALSLPVIAAIGALIRMLLRSNTTPAVDDSEGTVRTRPISVWRQSAWLELPDSSRYQIDQPLVRIGRETDNDLRLSDPTIHRYHAVLERSQDAEFFVSYLGDPDHEGLLVDGQAARRRRLRGGELLEIGSIKLRFSLSPA